VGGTGLVVERTVHGGDQKHPGRWPQVVDNSVVGCPGSPGAFVQGTRVYI
jgi:hypothetical protein